MPAAPAGGGGDEHVVALVRMQTAHRQDERCRLGQAELVEDVGPVARRRGQRRGDDRCQPGVGGAERGRLTEQLDRDGQGDVGRAGDGPPQRALRPATGAVAREHGMPGDHEPRAGRTGQRRDETRAQSVSVNDIDLDGVQGAPELADHTHIAGPRRLGHRERCRGERAADPGRTGRAAPLRGRLVRWSEQCPERGVGADIDVVVERGVGRPLRGAAGLAVGLTGPGDGSQPVGFGREAEAHQRVTGSEDVDPVAAGDERVDEGPHMASDAAGTRAHDLGDPQPPLHLDLGLRSLTALAATPLPHTASPCRPRRPQAGTNPAAGRAYQPQHDRREQGTDDDTRQESVPSCRDHPRRRRTGAVVQPDPGRPGDAAHQVRAHHRDDGRARGAESRATPAGHGGPTGVATHGPPGGHAEHADTEAVGGGERDHAVRARPVERHRRRDDGGPAKQRGQRRPRRPTGRAQRAVEQREQAVPDQARSQRDEGDREWARRRVVRRDRAEQPRHRGRHRDEQGRAAGGWPTASPARSRPGWRRSGAGRGWPPR